ncbi:RNase P modulator RnpM [Tepidibacillus marianensis]|uniref:RNase P modulator RnpM n=1 Tax=Tepidibacillus marianensis TaxID=3131995 RepID=UPI0030CCA2C5
MKNKKVPLRKCVACQEMKPKKELIRIVRTPEKVVVMDLTGKKSGRGAYLCLNQECIQMARKRKTLEKTLEVKIGEEIYQQVLMEIEKQNEHNR